MREQEKVSGTDLSPFICLAVTIKDDETHLRSTNHFLGSALFDGGRYESKIELADLVFCGDAFFD